MQTAFADVEDPPAGYPSGPFESIVPYVPIGCHDPLAEWASPWIA